MALALAVSLWIGGSGVAMAEEVVVSSLSDLNSKSGNLGDDKPIIKDGNHYYLNPYKSAKEFRITGEDYTDKRFSGTDTTGNVEGYTLRFYNGNANLLVGGSGTTGAKGNHVEIYGGSVSLVYGGRVLGAGLGDVNNNTVKVKGGMVRGWVCGGSGPENACENEVTISGATIGDNTPSLPYVVCGGHVFSDDKYATKNIVNLTNAIIIGNVYGGYGGNGGNLNNVDGITGNTLNLYGVNRVSGNGNVANFEFINIKKAQWGSPVLTLTGSISNGDGSLPTISTEGITFTGIDAVKAADQTPLIEGGMDNYDGHEDKIVGKTYKVGSTLQGQGHGVLDGSNLKFVADTGTESLKVQEQTHNTVMGAEASMAALSTGNDFIGEATLGLVDSDNTGTDGLATYAKVAGGSMNVETGSHVKTHTWNAILALGHKNEKNLSTTEYGAFFEYGKGNYTTFNGDERGDGSTHYTGGGILGKWQKNNDGLYVEGSLRVGSIHDDASNVLRDAARNPYSYNTDATYWGAHIGVGKELKVNTTDILDIYAKYFYNHRGSVAFDAAGNHYDLNAVESSVLRVGTRYTVKKDDKFNYYGGLALEHEFCGRAAGFVDGVAIRGADISGTSVRGEIGATFRPGEKSNVTLDLNLSGFAGKKQGFTGGLSAVFHI